MLECLILARQNSGRCHLINVLWSHSSMQDKHFDGILTRLKKLLLTTQCRRPVTREYQLWQRILRHPVTLCSIWEKQIFRPTSLIHWPLVNDAVILNVWFPNSLYRIVDWALVVKLWKPQSLTNKKNDSGHGLVPIGSKLLREQCWPRSVTRYGVTRPHL